MKRVFAVLCVLWSVAAMGNESMVCKQYGYTDKDEEFHSIKTHELQSTFVMEKDRIIFGSVLYKLVDPTTVGFEPDIIAYFNKRDSKVLYLYMNGEKKEIGISKLIPDSDAFFGDKSVFADCDLKPHGGSQDAVASKSSLAVNSRGVDPTLPVFSF